MYPDTTPVFAGHPDSSSSQLCLDKVGLLCKKNGITPETKQRASGWIGRVDSWVQK